MAGSSCSRRYRARPVASSAAAASAGCAVARRPPAGRGAPLLAPVEHRGLLQQQRQRARLVRAGQGQGPRAAQIRERVVEALQPVARAAATGQRLHTRNMVRRQELQRLAVARLGVDVAMVGVGLVAEREPDARRGLGGAGRGRVPGPRRRGAVLAVLLVVAQRGHVPGALARARDQRGHRVRQQRVAEPMARGRGREHAHLFQPAQGHGRIRGPGCLACPHLQGALDAVHLGRGEALVEQRAQLEHGQQRRGHGRDQALGQAREHGRIGRVQELVGREVVAVRARLLADRAALAQRVAQLHQVQRHAARERVQPVGHGLGHELDRPQQIAHQRARAGLVEQRQGVAR